VARREFERIGRKFAPADAYYAAGQDEPGDPTGHIEAAQQASPRANLDGSAATAHTDGNRATWESERMERSPELQRMMADWWEAFSRGDGTWFDRRVSREEDLRLAGTDSNEWLEGQRVGEHIKGAVEALGGTIKIFPGHPVACREGNVGWGSSRPTLTLPDGREINLRWSAVFRQEDGEWRTVQLHLSVAVPDEELLGMEIAPQPS
jgi:SnoaL-like domain